MPTAKTHTTPEQTVSPNVEGRPVRVLIIDDDKVGSLVIRSALAKAGWRVTESGTADGLEQFDKSNPDAVLVDLAQETEGSHELCLALRSRSQSALPILVMVHPDSSDAVRRAYESGATDFVFKPVDLEVLPFRLQSMIRASRSVSELRESERRLRKAQRVARLGSWELHPSGNLSNASEQALSLLGITASELPGYYTTLLRRVHPRDRLRVHKLFLSALGGAPSALEHRIVDNEGSTRIVRQETEITTTSSGDPIAFGTIQDITELRQTQEKLFRLHFYDPLTGLPNHLYLDDHLDRLKEKGDEGPFAAIVFKLMNFKRVNGSFGREVGDDMLKAFAERLSTMVESADGTKRRSAIGFEAVDVIARTGSAEFSLLLTLRLGQQGQLESLASQIAERLAEPFDADGTLIVLSLRTGIAVSPDAGTDAVSLVENARFAIHQASSSGNVHFHTHELHSEAADSFLLENDLRFALQKEEFAVHYQPKFNLATGRISGVEALVRWKHPKRGLVSPGFFIPIAEASGLILPLGEWVLRQGVLDIEILSHSMVPLSLAVNLSPRQFSDLQLLERIRRLLNDVSLDPKNIELEVTEGALIEDTSLGQQVLTQLKELGLRVALDDFGTGFSSLSYLKQYPFDVVKIDRSFIQDIAADASSRAIVKSSVELAHHLGKSVVAEGVETEEQLEVLKQLGCDEVQGFLLCRPLAMDDLTTWLASHLEDTAATAT